MKKLFLNLLAAAFVLAVSSAETKAQVSVGVSLWTPPAEYSNVNYYYLPDVEGYYYVPTHQYVYREGPNWVFRSSLPARYSSYDIRTGYKVAVDRPHPYRYFNHDRVSYGRYRGVHGGGIYRDHYRTRVITHTRYVNRTHYNTRYVHARPHGYTRGHGSYAHNRGQYHRGARPHPGGGRPGHGGEHGHGHDHH